MISFIGYYNYTVILTYISLFCSIAGMLFTVTHHILIVKASFMEHRLSILICYGKRLGSARGAE